MNYEIKTSNEFNKFYLKRNKNERNLIDNKLALLKLNPYKNSLDIKKLTGYDNIYRLRINNYRIIYEIHNSILFIFILNGGSRGDIYK